MTRASFCIITKNEDGNLTRLLDSIMPIVHQPWAELVILDTGSTDRTLEVARSYTENVFQKEFVPWNFSDARNECIAHAYGKRIVIFDSDEQLHQDSLYQLMEVLWNPKYDEYGTIFLQIHNYYDKEFKKYTEFSQPRIFRNDGKPIYAGSVHNRPEAPTPYFMANNIIVRHYGYMFQGKKELYDNKMDRTLPMLIENHEKDPTDLHVLTHLVKQTYCTQDWDKVLELGEKWRELMKGITYHEGWFSFLECYVQIAHAYAIKKNVNGILKTVAECEKFSDRVAPLYFLVGEFFAKNGDRHKARHYFEKGVNIFKTKGSPYENLLTSNARMMLPEVLHWLSIYYFQMKDYSKSGGLLCEAVRIDAGRSDIRWDVFNETDARKNLKRK